MDYSGLSLPGPSLVGVRAEQEHCTGTGVVLGCVVELQDSGGSGRDGGMFFWSYSMDPTALLPPHCVSVLDIPEGSLGLAPCVGAVLPYGSVPSASGCCSVSGEFVHVSLGIPSSHSQEWVKITFKM